MPIGWPLTNPTVHLAVTTGMLMLQRWGLHGHWKRRRDGRGRAGLFTPSQATRMWLSKKLRISSCSSRFTWTGINSTARG